MGVLIYGGTIYTMEDVDTTVDAVFIENGMISMVGEASLLRERFTDQIKEEWNLNGNAMYPGFVDSHLHIIGHGEKLLRLDLSKMTSAEEVLDALWTKATGLSKDEWLIADGWNENQWEEPRIIQKEELDAISRENPIILTRICRHAAIVNSKALKISKINKETVDPEGGVIVKDNKGNVTGYLLDKAQDLVKDFTPLFTQKQLEYVIELAIKDLLRVGLVGGHTEDLSYYGGFKQTLKAYQEILPKKYKFRAHLLVHHLVFDEMIHHGFRYGDGGEYTSLGAMKIFADGALGGRTARLSEAYEDDPGNFGISIHDHQELETFFKKARKFSFPVAVHAIGDQAIEEVAACMKRIPLSAPRKDRIIHAQVANTNTINKLKETDAVLDIQPSFVASDFPWVQERLGKDRSTRSYSWKTYIENDIACAAGSDAPIEEVNPLLGIQAAVTRKSQIDGKTYNEEEKLSVYEAISLYTKGSARAINHADDRGMIKPGYTADFTVLERDLYQENPENFHQIKVSATIVNGEVMYRKAH